ncbi:MAG: protein-glutamate O-methyltransferase CheR [Planctomycetota bacterium]|nr:protein-glutamate O-methyltransferase CheR [Planctomycetota bacterium]MDA1213085.1 protein-glutamate O-methyltransferase CheR [Planctomycetota bacterium]
MNRIDYEFLTHYLESCSGLALGAGKEYLLETRLIPLAQSWGIADVTELIHILRTKQDDMIGNAVVEAMTTSETSFFRDRHPFEEMQKTLLPAVINARRLDRHIRIWSAACSTGQEVYSLAMLLHEQFPEIARTWHIEILGTDISHNALTLAKEGVYSQFEVQRGLPIQYLMKYFVQFERSWQIKNEIRDMVTFKPLNLLDDLRFPGEFDIIFCRNVLIYFNAENKKRILDGIAKSLCPDGYLVLGTAETVLGITNTLRRDAASRSVVYVPNMMTSVKT